MSVYVVATKPQLERRAQRDILRAGVAAYAPSLTRWRHARGSKVPTKWPLLPGYVFVATEDLGVALPAIHASNYVTGLIGCEGRPTKIEEVWLARILIVECFGGFDYTLDRRPKMRPGQLVRIIAGAFHHQMAKFVSQDGDRASIEIPEGMFRGKMTIDVGKLVAA